MILNKDKFEEMEEQIFYKKKQTFELRKKLEILQIFDDIAGANEF